VEEAKKNLHDSTPDHRRSRSGRSHAPAGSPRYGCYRRRAGSCGLGVCRSS
jgi:hypothetical protein